VFLCAPNNPEFTSEDLLHKKSFKEAVELYFSQLNSTEQFIWESRLKKCTLVWIREQLGISTYQYQKTLETMKQKFTKCLVKTTKDPNAYQNFLF
jgi:hypothetical protein